MAIKTAGMGLLRFHYILLESWPTLHRRPLIQILINRDILRRGGGGGVSKLFYKIQ